MSWTQFHLKQSLIAHLAIVAKDGVFWALWHHRSWSVTSREPKVLVMWRQIRRLFLYVHIGNIRYHVSDVITSYNLILLRCIRMFCRSGLLFLKCDLKGQIDNKPALVQVIVWRRSDNKSFSEPIVV